MMVTYLFIALFLGFIFINAQDTPEEPQEEKPAADSDVEFVCKPECLPTQECKGVTCRAQPCVGICLPFLATNVH
ncbi:hypothetical protein L596_012203 [Steinernema carpocapsae]|uniref:WAP domain-containing protein n=1 Tax=Steinernema carpocapsae TaxID=34508 RepID=A0A4U5NWZ9_STECR|nr:hypothetical protein L596_012203 [Steinernema carpocapsae]